MMNSAKQSMVTPGSGIAAEPGQRISELLAIKRVRPRDIEQKSRLIADARGNSGFYISHASLAAIKAGALPSIYKVFSLAACCGVSYAHLLSLFGIVESQVLADDQAPISVNEEALETPVLEGHSFRFRLNFDVRVPPRETRLVSGEDQDLQLLPACLTSSLEPKRFLYAVVGLNDHGMSDIIPPGSLVEVDRDRTEVPNAGWSTLQQRPIFLVWHEEGYGCGWCQITKNQLLLIPHPGSTRRVLQLKLPSEAVIIGQIVHIWYSLGSSQPLPRDAKRVP